jgi:hypothetical protein
LIARKSVPNSKSESAAYKNHHPFKRVVRGGRVVEGA